MCPIPEGLYKYKKCMEYLEKEGIKLNNTQKEEIQKIIREKYLFDLNQPLYPITKEEVMMYCQIHPQIILNSLGICVACENKKEKWEKQTFKSGATSSEQVPGYDMLSELFLTRVAKRFDLGKEKYGKFNYRKGLKDKEFIIDRLNHAFLHLKKAVDRIENDLPYEDDDLSAVAVNIAMAMEYQVENALDKDPDETKQSWEKYQEAREIGENLKEAIKQGQKLGAMKMPDGWPKTCSCSIDYPFGIDPQCLVHKMKS